MAQRKTSWLITLQKMHFHSSSGCKMHLGQQSVRVYHANSKLHRYPQGNLCLIDYPIVTN